MNRSALFYVGTLILVGLGIAGILHFGNLWLVPSAAPLGAVETKAAGSPLADVAASVQKHLDQPLGHLFLQLLLIISAARVTGRVFTHFGQPAVVGEMVAGILLGPSLFGWLAPQAFGFVFPADSLAALQLFSQIGVCLFMFSVGMEVDMRQVRTKARAAVVVSHASIVIPYFLGVLLAVPLYESLAQPGASFSAFALFMGISMSITAFPVLARILQERGLAKTTLGATAITCAAVDDVTAWSLMAFVVAIVAATSLGAAALNLLLVLAFIAVMVLLVRPILPRVLGVSRLESEEPSRGSLAAVVCVVIASALCTEVIGIHALFGAFLAGAIMPELGGFRHKLSVRIEHFSSVLLLPLFFAYTGLRTQIGLLNDAASWLICLAIIGVATLGKLGGSAVAARATGMPWRESLQLGALMNTRGLMELIALNIGYDLGILSPRIFAMLVLMALATTLLTGPLLTLFSRRAPAPSKLTLPSLT